MPSLAGVAELVGGHTARMFAGLRPGPDGRIPRGGHDAQGTLVALENGGLAMSAALYWACLVIDLQPPRRPWQPRDEVLLSVCDFDTSGVPPWLRPPPRWLPEVRQLLSDVGNGALDAVLALRARAERPHDPDNLLDAVSTMFTLASSAHRLLAARLAARAQGGPGLSADLPVPPVEESLALVTDQQIARWLKGHQAADIFLRSGLQTGMWSMFLATGLAKALGVPVRLADGRDDADADADATALLAGLIRQRMMLEVVDLEAFPYVEDTLTLGAGLLAILEPSLGVAETVFISSEGEEFEEEITASPRAELPDRIQSGVKFAALAASIARHGRDGVAPVLDTVRAGGGDAAALTLSAGLDWLALHAHRQEERVLGASVPGY